MEIQNILNVQWACLALLVLLFAMLVIAVLIILQGKQEQADFIAWTVEEQIKKSFKKQKVPNLTKRVRTILEDDSQSDGESLDAVLQLLKVEGMYHETS